MSQEHRQPGTTIAIVGLGLIGGSLGRALRLAGYHVTGFARRPAVRRRALALDAVDVAATDLRETVDAEIIVLAVPVLATQAVFRQLAPQLHPGTIVTDVASTKARVLGWGGRAPAGGRSFCRGASDGRPGNGRDRARGGGPFSRPDLVYRRPGRYPVGSRGGGDRAGDRDRRVAPGPRCRNTRRGRRGDQSCPVFGREGIG